MVTYSYDRTAAKKPEKKPAEKPAKPAETTITRKAEVEKAIKAVHAALDAVHDCAPSGRDFQKDGDYDSKGYAKAVAEHGKRIDALHDVVSDLSEILAKMK